MAVCEVCGEKIGAGNQCYFGVPGVDSYLSICKTCDEHLNKLRSKKSSTQEYGKAWLYFEPLLKKGHMRKEVSNYISSLLPETDDTASEYIKRKLEQEKLDAEKQEARKKAAFQTRTENAQNFKMTTGYQFDGYKISEYIKVVSGEVVLGTGFLADLSGLVNDTLGTRSGTYEAKMGNAKEFALNEAKARALDIGANALIGIDFDFMTLGNNMIVVSANGTAVHIEET